MSPTRIDIVAVHGWSGDPVLSWVCRETLANWLSDFLPHEIDPVRIITYGPDLRLGLRTIARDLMTELSVWREADPVRTSTYKHYLSNIPLFGATADIGLRMIGSSYNFYWPWVRGQYHQAGTSFSAMNVMRIR